MPHQWSSPAIIATTARGRRAWRKTESGTTAYLWHNDVLLGEQNPRGHWQWYLRDPQSDEPLLTLIDGQPYFYELDHRMMPVRLWDQNGQKVWQGNADAWGNCQPEILNNAIHQPLRLPGQFEDELTGIVQNRFRDYDPSTGRYLTPDPYGIKGGLNAYRYTKNPIDFMDPLGLVFKPCVTASNADKADAAPIPENVPAAQETPAEEGFGAFVLGGPREFLHDTLVSAHSYMTGLTPEAIGDPMGLSPKNGAQAAGAQAYKDNALAINLATAFIPGRHQKVARDIANGVSNKNGFTRFSGSYDKHIVFRDFDVPRKRGIGGAHNRDEFFKYANEFKVEKVVPHPTLDGVETIRYRMSALDRAGNPTGEYRAAVLEKTVYDPSKISNEQFMDWGRQAAAEAQALGKLSREWVGTAPNGLEFRGYLDETGAVKSFFPNF